uniref:EGF-like domain-containing protein n=1 Tax=Macrostomum lignano TaxID=282301 RepID=A0A1I8J0D2_9PLAT
MSRLLLVVLASLPVLAFGAAVTCRYGDRTLRPGQSHVFEQNCARHNCTCSPGVAGSDMCKSTMIGCLESSGSRCYKAGEAATVTGASGPMHCVCQQESGGSFTFANCRTETCRDSRTGEAKKKGQQVTTVSGGVTYICTCAGVDGFQNCRTDEAVRNEGRCLDAASGSYVERRQRIRQEGRREGDGGERRRDVRVRLRRLEGYRNCLSKEQFDNAGKCKDIEGRYVDRGQRYRVRYGGVRYECTCDGDNRGKECS